MAPRVPTFSLYGESSSAALGDWLHCESIAERSRRHDWEIGPHRHHHFFQILYLSGGAGECRLGDRHARLVPATAVTVPPGSIHGFRFSDDVEGLVLTLTADRAARIIDAAAAGEPFAESRLVQLSPDEAAGSVGRCLAIVGDEVAERRPGRDALVEAQLASVFVLLGRNLSGASAGQPPVSALGRRAEQFRRLLNQHFRARRTVRFYADHLGVSETHLNRICRATMDRSALAAIHDRILAEASRDLAFTTMGVAEIGRSLGFDDAAYFSRFFATRAGLSPNSYRRQRLMAITSVREGDRRPERGGPP